jgi:hypothetical protein
LKHLLFDTKWLRALKLTTIAIKRCKDTISSLKMDFVRIIFLQILTFGQILTQTMKKILLFIALIITVAACKQDAKTADTTNSSNAAAASAPVGSGELQLTCEDAGSAGDMPKNAVYAIVKERKTKLMEINAACMPMEPGNYANYGIPGDAVAVLGSWFAGIGDFFYAKQEGNQINVYHSAIGEEAPPGGIHTYYKIATYEDGKITVLQTQ